MNTSFNTFVDFVKLNVSQLLAAFEHWGLARLVPANPIDSRRQIERASNIVVIHEVPMKSPACS